jgi:glutamate-ammonia-ligase adenylyltransferase
MAEPGARIRTRFAGSQAVEDAERLLFAQELGEAEVADIYTRWGFAHPAKADQRLLKMAGPPATRRVLAQVMPVLLEALGTAADPDRTLINVRRLSEAYASRDALYSQLAEDPQAVASMVKVFATSQFLADMIIRWPHLTILFFDRERLLAPKSRRKLEDELVEALAAYSTLDGALDALRAFNRREVLRIGIRDITDRADLLTTTAELSNLADVSIHAAHRLAERELTAIRSVAAHSRFAVIGMGKLGGGELNYSSDIDLMFVYEVGKGDDPERVRAYFTKLAELLVQALAKHTGEGHVYRVDTTLRPEGRDGPLVRSIGSYETYYRKYAATWEFQALIKARPVGGDASLGDRFIEMATPFVYRETFGPDDIARIRAMKERVEQGLEREGELYRNIKLGFGGIRDVEFTVQLMQLVYGGREPRLRSGNTLRCLSALRQVGLITERELAEVSDAYIFLRDVEHHLQIMQSLQEHSLPPEPAKLALFARRFGYLEGPASSGERFEMDLGERTGVVRAFFTTHFLAESYEQGPATLATLLGSSEPEKLAADVLGPFGFEDPVRAAKAAQRLTEAAGRVDAEIVTWIERVFSMAVLTPDPDAALFQLGRFVKSMGGGPQVVRMLMEGRFVLDLLLRVFGSSEFLADELVRHPEFLDVISSPANAFKEKPYPELVGEIRATTARADAGGGKLDAVRRYKRRETLRIGALDLVGGADVRVVSEELTKVADACVREAYTLTEEALTAELGSPEGSAFAVIGLGKRGSRELNYSSDLDVVFVYRGEGTLADGTPYTGFWTRLAEDLMAALGAPTAEGNAYWIDPNLRPEGRNGPLVRSLDSYAEYYEKWADIWEFQAMIRARPICGDMELAGDFMQLLQHLVYREDFGAEDEAEIRRLKARMEAERLPPGTDPRRHVKLGPGGISDVEFTVQILQLRHGREHRPLRRANTFEAIRQLAKEELITPDDAKVLSRGLAFLRRVELRLQILKRRPEHIVTEDSKEVGRLARRLGYHGDLQAAARIFWEDYTKATAAVRRAYERLGA